MKKRISKVLAVFIALVITLVGCDSKGKGYSTEGEAEGGKKSEVVKVWSYYGGFLQAKNELKDKGIDVEIIRDEEGLSYSTYIPKFLEKATAGEVPDVLVIDSNDFGVLSNLDIFEDLFESPYNINKYKEDYNEVAWEMGKSFDKQKMIGVAYASAPVVTYYRQDIFRELGIGNTPKEVEAAMATEEGWEKVAEKMLNSDKKMKAIQFVADPLTLFSKQYSPFDENMEFQYTASGEIGEKFRKLLKLSKNIYDNNYAIKEDFFKVGTEAIQNEYLGMVYLAPWGLENIKSAGIEEQKGKWAVTSLPFGIDGWNNSTMLLIPKNSKNKEKAWEFVKHVSFEMKDDNAIGSVYSYKPVRVNSDYKNDFLAENQMDQKLYEELIDKNKTNKFITPLDNKVFDIWVSQVNTGIENGKSEEEIIKSINDAIKLNLQDEIDILKESLENK